MSDFIVGDRVRFTNGPENKWPWFEGATGTVVRSRTMRGDYAVLWDAGGPPSRRDQADSGERMKDAQETNVGGAWLSAETVDIDTSDISEVEAFLNGNG